MEQVTSVESFYNKYLYHYINISSQPTIKLITIYFRTCNECTNLSKLPIPHLISYNSKQFYIKTCEF